MDRKITVVWLEDAVNAYEAVYTCICPSGSFFKASIETLIG